MCLNDLKEKQQKDSNTPPGRIIRIILGRLSPATGIRVAKAGLEKR